MDETLEDQMIAVFQEHARARGYSGVVIDHVAIYVVQGVKEDGGTDTTLVLCRPEAQMDYVTKGMMVDAMDALRTLDIADASGGE